MPRLRASHRGPLFLQLRKLRQLLFRRHNYNSNSSNHRDPSIGPIIKWERFPPVGLYLAVSRLADTPIQRRLQLMISIVRGEICKREHLENCLILGLDATNLFPSNPAKVLCETSKPTVVHLSCNGRFRESKEEDLQSHQRHFKPTGVVVKMLLDLGHAVVHRPMSAGEAAVLRVACLLAALMHPITLLMVDENRK